MLRITILIFGLTSFFLKAGLTIEASNNWNFHINGRVNTFVTSVSCDDNPGNVNGTVLLCSGENKSAVTNGYAPASFEFGVSKMLDGYEISAYVSIQEGTTDNAAFSLNDSAPSDLVYFKVKNKSNGEVIVGRYFGVFGFDALVLDMTGAGVGATVSAASPLNTQLGGAGYGYIFPDRLSQITYIHSFGDTEAVIGVFQPLDTLSFGGLGFSGDTGSKRPGIHSKIKHNFSNGFISSSFITQGVDNSGMMNDQSDIDYTARGLDIAANMQFDSTQFSFGGYQAKGLGYYGLLIDGSSITGKARTTSGWYVQATKTFGKTKLGLNYGISKIKRASDDPDTLVDENKKVTLGIYYPILESITIAGEISSMLSTSHLNEEIKNGAVSLGASISF